MELCSACLGPPPFLFCSGGPYLRDPCPFFLWRRARRLVSKVVRDCIAPAHCLQLCSKRCNPLHHLSTGVAHLQPVSMQAVKNFGESGHQMPSPGVNSVHLFHGFMGASSSIEGPLRMPLRLHCSVFDLWFDSNRTLWPSCCRRRVLQCPP